MLPFIQEILDTHEVENLQDAPLIKYLNLKMGAINADTKTRRNFGNIYAIYSLTKSYIIEHKDNMDSYLTFEGYDFQKILDFIKTLYGATKIQNHALNNRLNSEFINKFGSNRDLIKITNSKYKINEYFIFHNNNDISHIIIEIIDKYISLLHIKDTGILYELEELVSNGNINEKKDKLLALLNEKSEARIFEVVSFAILKNYYSKKFIYMSESIDEIKRIPYQLFKTGRTNANDGGIDFVLKPLGKFYQVTEVNNFDKYLLDMNKVLHYPITFVVKTENKNIYNEFIEYIESKNLDTFSIDNYKKSIEGMITINEIKEYLNGFDNSDINSTLSEIIIQYKLEFNI